MLKNEIIYFFERPFQTAVTETMDVLQNKSLSLLLRINKSILKELVGVQARLGWEAVKK